MVMKTAIVRTVLLRTGVGDHSRGASVDTATPAADAPQRSELHSPPPDSHCHSYHRLMLLL